MAAATEQQIVAAALALKGQHDALEAERARLADLQKQRDAVVAQIAAQRDRVRACVDAVAAARLELRALVTQV